MRLFEFIDPLPCYYHGSTVPNLRYLKTRYSKLVDASVVFAATMPEIAIAMAGHWSDDDFHFGHQTNAKHRDFRFPPYTMTELLPGTLERFFTQPMYLYLVPTHHFKPDDRLQDFEVPSHHDVPVHAMITVDHPLDYLRGSPILHLETV